MSLSSEINQFQDEVREGYVPEKKTAPDYGEPWEAPGGYGKYALNVLNRKKEQVHLYVERDRVAACVNACAGMIDPSAEIQAMREAIREARHGIDYALLHHNLDPESAVEHLQSTLAKLQPFIKP